jgi:hypothetical protein
MRIAALALVALASTLTACTDAIPESAYATPPAQGSDTLPSCSSVDVSSAFWADPVDLAVEDTQYVVLEGDDPVCITSFQGLELLAERVNRPKLTPDSNPMPGSPFATPASNPMPGVSPATPASNPMPGSPIATPASNPMPGVLRVALDRAVRD